MESLKATKLVAVVILIVTTLSVALAYVPGTQRFTMYSIDDTGAFGLSETYKILSSSVPTRTIIGSISTLLRENVSNAIIMIIGPYKSFSSDEISSILFLLARGNSLILANDFGSGNQLLTVLSYLLYEYQQQNKKNATLLIKKVAFNGSVLMDAVSFVDTPADPLVTNINHDYDPLGFFDGVNSLATYMPTTISAYVWDNSTGTPKEYRTPIPGQAMTTQYSRLETDMKSVKDGTYKPDPDERGGVPFSVVLYFTFSRNQFLMLVSDPDVFSNRYVRSHAYGNYVFINNIARVAKEMNATIFIDQAHQPAIPLSSTAYLSVILHSIAYFTLFPIVGLFVPWSIYTYLRRLFPEYEARGILMKKVKRRTAYEFNPDAKAALEKNDFTEPLRLLIEKFKNEFSARYGYWSLKEFKRIARRRGVSKKLIKTFEEALRALERGHVTRDEFVLYARTLNEIRSLLGVRRYER